MIVEHRLIRRDLDELININEYVESNAIIDAKSDFGAVQIWLARFKNENTHRAYSRDTMRFLSWLIFIKGKHLQHLMLEDINDFIKFLQNPDSTWCMKHKKLHHYDARWRPFSKPLSKRSIGAAISVLQSLFAFLEESGFINKNPVRLLKISNIIGNMQAQKYSVYARMLEADEWCAVLHTLQNLPAENKVEKEFKARANLLFCMLYILGLRINEASSCTWSNFRKLDGRWWFFIQGKGDKLGHIPVNESLLQAIHNYRAIFGFAQDFNKDDSYVFTNEETGNNLSTRTLYNCVKHVGNLASEKFEDEEKQEKVRALSPHWLRHLSASHQDMHGIPLTMIRDNHRHSSINTTQIYMHSEDIARHSKMEGHVLNTQPVNTGSKMEHYLTIKLAKGPLDKDAAVGIISKSIETSILQNAQCIENSSVIMKYKLIEPVSDALVDTIKMLCKVWMFDPVIEQGSICHR
jgi:site-specific recombinase XerD